MVDCGGFKTKLKKKRRRSDGGQTRDRRRSDGERQRKKYGTTYFSNIQVFTNKIIEYGVDLL